MASDAEKLIADLGGKAVIEGDIKLEVSLVGVLTGLQDSVSSGFARVETSMQGKADKVDVESLRGEFRALSGTVKALEDWKNAQEHKGTSTNEHLKLAAKMTGAVWAALTTVLLILATAGVFHP